ncbi:hypothetical protein P691DRAFT_383962 [Macrolepiota fuliginosa MF-IS2]|uniref:NACHT domain-containing protein n=1 Tax=Macrolepiota fuliginosa MF-IS2 TaxID=1400762 RepID=A0A9P5X5K5_9AGAR|nr:hypothetical protein P691DRAFT_383962 [Macrolepiota fuliginosa MF-IS2]
MLGKSIWIWCKKRLRRVHPHQPRQKAQPSARTEDLGPSPSFHPEPPTTVETTPSGQPTTPVVAEDVESNRRLSGQHLAPGNGGPSSNPGISSVNNPTTIGAQFSEQQQIVQTQHTGLQNIAYQINHMDTKLLESMSPYTIPGAGIYSSMRDLPAKCHPGTRTHILADIRNRIDSGTRMIWIHGPAGVGKSAIMQTVAKAMSSQAPCAGLFLSRYGDPPRNDSKKVFTTLAYSLAVDNRNYRQYIEEKLSNDPAFLEKSISEQFMDLFLTPFIEHRVDAGPQRWVVLLDGLDESKNENNDQCMIVNLIRDSILDHAGTVPFIWIIASRPEAHLMSALMKAKQNFRDRPAEFFERTIPVESDAAAQDIERYLHAEFAKIREMHPDSLPKPISTWPSAGDFLKVAEASSGLFVLASTMMKYISVDRPASRLKLIVGLIDRSTLHPTGTPFSSLDITYTQIVSEIPKGLLPVTNSLLSYFHLIGREGLIGACNVLGLSQDEAYDALRQLHSVLTYPPPDIAEDNGVEFFHASFPDFLFSPSRSQNYYVDLNQELTHIWWCYVRILKESYQTNSAAFISHDHVDIHWLLEDDDSHIDKLQRELLRKAQHGWVHLLIEYGHSWCTSCPQSKNDRRLMVGDNELIDVFQSIHPVLFSGNEFPVGMFVDWLSDHVRP